jgi:glutamine amidotransferase-like uncharacterized protein
MKVKIINKDGAHTEVEPKFLRIGNKNLEQILLDYKEMKNELIKFKEEMLKREAELLKLWVKIH